MTSLKKKLIFSALLVFIVGMFLFKNILFSYLIERNFKKNGVKTKIESFKINIFSNAFFFKGEIEQPGKITTLQNVTGHYLLGSVFDEQKHFSDLYINGGKVVLNENNQFEKFNKMPFIDRLEIIDFYIENPKKKLGKSGENIAKITKLRANQLHKSNDLIRFSNLDLEIDWNEINIIAESSDGQIVKIYTQDFPIEKIYEYLPPNFSIVKKAMVSVAMEFEYPSPSKEGSIRVKIKCRDFHLKEQGELSFLEMISLPIINSIVNKLKSNGAESVVFFSEKELQNDSLKILNECNSKILSEVIKLP